MEKKSICLIGNPNSGKTTLYNRLTGAREKVGNYSGVTVEKFIGHFKLDGQEIELVDLPGTYSLTARSNDELVTRNHLLEHKPDLIIHVADASNLERSLYLPVQVRELDIPMVVVLNKWDISSKQGTEFNLGNLEEVFGAKFIPAIAEDGTGIEELRDTVRKLLAGKTFIPYAPVKYNQEVENELANIAKLAAEEQELSRLSSARWLSVKLLEADRDIRQKCYEHGITDESPLFKQAEASRRHIEHIFGEKPNIVLTEDRYGFINGALKESMVLSEQRKLDISDRIDNIILNPILGLPVFLLVMFVIFYIPFTLGEPLTAFVDTAFSSLGQWLKGALPAGIIRGLLVDGIIGGVGGVLVFLPQILLLFACISFLEASGYMARAAFVVDRFMHKLGLHGKSFVPLVVGFGCTVPALLATRTLENRNDRLTTMLAAPFMSCSARLPVYILIVSALFPTRSAGLAVFSMYLLGIIIAIITAKIFRRFVYKGDKSHFVMELPPYRMPTLGGVLHQMWEKGLHYIKKAGTLLVVASIIFWFLTNFPKPDKQTLQNHRETVETVRENTADFRKDKLAVFKRAEMPPRAAEKYITRVASIESNVQAAQQSAAGHSQTTALSDTNTRRKLRAAQPELYNAALAIISNKNYYQNREQSLENTFIAGQRLNSYAGQLGHLISPLLAPAGLGDWRISTALISGFIAKELVVSTLGTIYGLGEGDEGSAGLRNRLRNDGFFQSEKKVPAARVVVQQNRYYLDDSKGLPLVKKGNAYYKPNVLIALSLMVFVLLYVPCQAATIVYFREAGAANALLMLVYTTGVAYVMSILVFQLGTLLGLG